MTHADMHKAVRDRLATLVAQLRTEPGSFFARIRLSKERWHISTQHPDEGCTTPSIKPDGYRELTGAIVADLVERNAEELAAATVQDLTLAVKELVPEEFRAMTLASDALLEQWPVSEQIEAGLWLLAWRYGPSPDTAWPDCVSHAEFTAWIKPTLTRHKHQGAIATGTGQLLAPILRHPKTDRPWTLWPPALAYLYLADPTATANRCCEAIQRLSTEKLADAHLAAARAALEDLGVADDIGPKVGTLAEELRKQLKSFSTLLSKDAAIQSLRDRGKHALLPWDEEATKLFAGFGSYGAGMAQALRKRAQEDWTAADTSSQLFVLWTPRGPNGVPAFAKTLAKVLWADVIEPQLTQQLNRKDSAGVCMPAMDSLIAAARRGGVQLRLPEQGENKAELLDFKGRRVATLAPEVSIKHLPLEALSSLTTQRIVRWVIWRAYERKWIEGQPEPCRILVEGGKQELAYILGMASKKASDEINDALLVLSSLLIESPKGQGKIFAHYEHKAYCGQRARLEMVVLGPFAPDYIATELKGHRRSCDKWLIPIPMPHQMPPFVGRPQDHAAQAQLQVLALRELRINAEELAQRGHVEIPEKRWLDLANEAGVPKVILPKILEAYPHGDDRYPAFLLRPGEGTFTLGDEYEREAQSIRAAAEAQIKGRNGGKQRTSHKAGKQSQRPKRTRA